MTIREKICDYAIYYQGNWSKIAQAISTDESVPHFKCDHFITFYDVEYPEAFRNLRFPPWVIFYEGDLSLLKKECVSIVGSRNASEYGINCTKEIVRRLSDRYVIVSGLAKGIDAVAHKTALEINHDTIAVIGSGLKTHYPKCNEYLYQKITENGLIISEYPDLVGVKKEHFPWRNRLIAALGERVFVTEATCKSGTMLTVNEAITLGKDVYVVPYPLKTVNDSGCNLLLSQGAFLLYDWRQLNYL